MLGVLSAVESDGRVTQRKLSDDLGIALGLANLYVKRCVRKGWIKIGHVPMHRYAYYLTPLGFREKARLTREYLAWNLEFFRRARRQSTELFANARARGFGHFALIGAGELAEVAILSAADAEVEVVGVIDASAASRRCAGIAIYRSTGDFLSSTDCRAKKTQAILVTQASDSGVAEARELAHALSLPISAERILLPRILNLSWATSFPDKGERA
jgi:hypothetical protein